MGDEHLDKFTMLNHCQPRSLLTYVKVLNPFMFRVLLMAADTEDIFYQVCEDQNKFSLQKKTPVET